MSFFEDVYAIVKKIPEGKVATYGQIAQIMGKPRSARVVGWALHSNPYRGVVPCHRVVNRKGELSGGFAFGGKEVQKKLLENEGVIFLNSYTVNMEKCFWKPSIT